MGNKNYLKFIIPVVAVLVVVESIILVGNLNTRSSVTDEKPAVTGEPKVAVAEPTRAAEALQILVETEEKSAVVGKVARARVEVLPRVNKAVDGVSLYVKFDPSMVKVSDLKFNADMPKPIVGKISKSGDMIVVNYLIAAKDGFSLVKGVKTNLLTFNYEPLKKGPISFNLVTSKESKDSATMMVENGSSLNLSFEPVNLMINVTK
jgi:hypothetical protein